MYLCECIFSTTTKKFLVLPLTANLIIVKRCVRGEGTHPIEYNSTTKPKFQTANIYLCEFKYNEKIGHNKDNLNLEIIFALVARFNDNNLYKS